MENTENIKNIENIETDIKIKKKYDNKKYLQTFYEKHPELKEPQMCQICRGTYSYLDKSRHLKSKRHKIFLD